jgi:hypothetical protein
MFKIFNKLPFEGVIIDFLYQLWILKGMLYSIECISNIKLRNIFLTITYLIGFWLRSFKLPRNTNYRKMLVARK